MNNEPAPQESRPWDLNQQLHGQEYDEAILTIEHLRDIEFHLSEQANILSNSIAIAKGAAPLIFGQPTSEGIAYQEVSSIPINASDLEDARAQHAELFQRAFEISKEIATLSAQTWQETGIRLFNRWRQGDGEATELLQSYFNFWNTFSPDDYYETCQTTKEEVTTLIRSALMDLQQRWSGFNFDQFSTQKELISRIGGAVSSLGVDITEYDL